MAVMWHLRPHPQYELPRSQPRTYLKAVYPSQLFTRESLLSDFPASRLRMSVPIVATRVVLLFKSDKSDEDIVRAFLRQTNRPESQYENNEHFIHLDPDRAADSKWSHIVLDMHSRLTQDPDLDTLPHEFYKAKNVGDSLYVSYDKLNKSLIYDRFFKTINNDHYCRQTKSFTNLLRWGGSTLPES